MHEEVPVLIVGGGGAGLTASSMWIRRRQIAPDGAILVRPDRFVAWRSKSASEAPLEQLSNALNQILARPIAVEPAAA